MGTPALSSECTGAGIRLVRASTALVVLVRAKPCQVGMDSFISTEQANVEIGRILGDREFKSISDIHPHTDFLTCFPNQTAILDRDWCWDHTGFGAVCASYRDYYG